MRIGGTEFTRGSLTFLPPAIETAALRPGRDHGKDPEEPQMLAKFGRGALARCASRRA